MFLHCQGCDCGCAYISTRTDQSPEAIDPSVLVLNNKKDIQKIQHFDVDNPKSDDDVVQPALRYSDSPSIAMCQELLAIQDSVDVVEHPVLDEQLAGLEGFLLASGKCTLRFCRILLTVPAGFDDVSSLFEILKGDQPTIIETQEPEVRIEQWQK